MTETKTASKHKAEDRKRLKEFGEKLRRIRIARGLTQDEVAKNAFSKSYLSAVELGKLDPSIRALRILAERLQVPLSQLLSPVEEVTESQMIEFVFAQARLSLELDSAQSCSTTLQNLAKINIASLSEAQRGEAFYLEAYCLAKLQQYTTALKKLQAARAIWQNLAFKEWLVRVDNLIGEIYLQQGNLPAAHKLFEASYATVQAGQVREPLLKLKILNNLLKSNSLSNQETTQQRLEEVAQLLKSLENPHYWVEMAQNLAEQYAAQGDFVQARASLERASGLARGLTSVQQLVQSRMQLGEVYLAEENFAAAQQQYNAALANTSWRWRNPTLVEIYVQLARLALKQDHLAEAVALTAEAEAALPYVSSHYGSTQHANAALLLLKVQVAEQQGQRGQADTYFMEAEAILQTLDDRLLLAQAYAEYSELLRARGNTSAAYQYLKEAVALRDKPLT